MSAIKNGDNVNPSPMTRVLQLIPTELCQVLADLIDLDSAKQLMLTCKALYPIGEIRFYSDIDVTGSYTGESNFLSEVNL